MNRRVCRGDSRGTVRFVGPVPGGDAAKVYAGVQWDDPARGKHAQGGGDVSHEGQKLFTCDEGTSGSLVPLGSLSWGRSLSAAVHEKYVQVEDEDALLSSGVTVGGGDAGADSAGAREVELVGFLGVQRQWADTASLGQIAAPDMEVADIRGGRTRVFVPGSEADDGEGVIELKAAEEVDLSGNLIPSLGEFLEGACSLPELRILIGNRMRFAETFIPRNPDAMPPTLHTLVLGYCHLSWESVLAVAQSLPVLMELYLTNNNAVPVAGSDTEPLRKLHVLSLESNGLTHWRELAPLATLPRLRRLLVSGNMLGDDGALGLWGDNPWPAMSSVSASSCGISEWSTIDAFNRVLSLRELRVEPDNPITGGMGLGASRRNIIGRVGWITSLNSSPFTQEERDEAEKYYLKTCANEAREHGWGPWAENPDAAGAMDALLSHHPRWPALVAKYGEPVADKPEAETLEQEMVAITLFCGPEVGKAERPGSQVKRLPLSFAVSDLKALFRNLFGLDAQVTDAEGLQLNILHSQDPVPEVLDDDTRTIGYYNAMEGSRIVASVPKQ